MNENKERWYVYYSFFFYSREYKRNSWLVRFTSFVSQIANLIKINRENQSGIIYCFSHAECNRRGYIKTKNF
jgi:hypothetical protein